MDSKFIDQLLYEEEGPTLDFKRDQYAFAKATEEERPELLKDILGFVNCWRREPVEIENEMAMTLDSGRLNAQCMSSAGSGPESPQNPP